MQHFRISAPCTAAMKLRHTERLANATLGEREQAVSFGEVPVGVGVLSASHEVFVSDGFGGVVMVG
jgi:hypothetical protein